MSNKEHINIFPSRASLRIINIRLASATKGHKLLKKKSEALQVHFRDAIRNMVKEKQTFMESLQDGFQLVAKAKYSCRNLKYSVLDDVNTAHVKVRRRIEYYAGVTINILDCYDDSGDDYKCVGLSRGGQDVNNVKKHFKNLIKTAIYLASIKIRYTKLEEVIKLTNIRVNGIEHIIIPKLTNTISYILTQLEENEREEFFRLKLVQEKKNKLSPEKKRQIVVGSCAFLTGDSSQLVFGVDIWSDEDFSIDE